jgi:hypothetical protein
MIKVDKKIKVTKYLGMVRVYSMAKWLIIYTRRASFSTPCDNFCFSSKLSRASFRFALAGADQWIKYKARQ